MTTDKADPRGLIREAFNIEGIDAAQCRSIFLDWAMFDARPEQQTSQLEALLARHRGAHPAHPMVAILEQALTAEARPREARPRRSGRRALRG